MCDHEHNSTLNLWIEREALMTSHLIHSCSRLGYEGVRPDHSTTRPSSLLAWRVLKVIDIYHVQCLEYQYF